MVPESSLVVDSGPLIAFARIGQLALLPQLAPRIVIPPAVWHEVTVSSSEAPAAHEVRQLLRPQLEALQASGIYVSQALNDAVLEDVGER